jgi:ribosomal protein S21
VSNRNYRNHRHRGNHRHRRGNKERYVPPHTGKRPSNLTVIPRPGEHPERAIKRFLKKCKKLRIVETYREKTDYYEKPSVIKRRRAIRRERAIKKANQKNIHE